MMCVCVCVCERERERQTRQFPDKVLGLIGVRMGNARPVASAVENMWCTEVDAFWDHGGESHPETRK